MPSIMKMPIPLETAFTATPRAQSSDLLLASCDPVNGHLPLKSEFLLKRETPSMFEHFDHPFSVEAEHDNDIATPLLINPSVLDSVLSSVLDDHSGTRDHTPMFDDLELGPESEWGLLFGVDSASANQDSPLIEFGPEDYISQAPSPPEPKQILPEQKSVSRKRSRTDSDESASQSAPIQVASPVATPVLDMPKKPKVDKFGCIAYNKKQRSRPLEPIEPVSDDPVLLKRAKNTEAARRSRARKMERMGQLEEKIEDLIEDKIALTKEVDRLRDLLSSHGVAF